MERPRGVRKPGRPRVRASWFAVVARTMADGTPLKEALKRHGITLDDLQIRALYRNKESRRATCRRDTATSITTFASKNG
jgi:hypothetical protein